MKKTNLIIVLTAGYLLCQIIADVTASKMVGLFGIYVPAAVFIYALTFTVNILGRLTRDITLYADAEQFQSMLRDPVPIWGLTVDITQAIHNTFTLIEGKPEELSDKQWENKVDRIIKHYRSFLPYGFNTIEKATTYATSKNMYNR